MRLQFDRPSAAQRAALEQRFARLREPAGALDALRRHLPPGELGASDMDGPARAICTPMAHPPDRFVIRVDVETAAGRAATYALKVYADARGERIAAVYDALAERWPSGGEPGPVCLPLAYIPDEYLFISPWVHGRSLWSGITDSDTALVEHAATHAATTLAQLHRAGPELAATVATIEPEASAARILDVSLARCERLCARWPEPEVTATVRPLMAALQATLPLLAPARPTLVHGDPGPGNFLWDGARWVLLDLDMFGRTDPAYDLGYLLAQVLRRCLENPPLDARAPELLAALRGAYMAALPEVAAGNITFFYALTLVRKLYTVRKQQADGWPEVFAVLARHADAALRELRAERAENRGQVRVSDSIVGPDTDEMRATLTDAVRGHFGAGARLERWDERVLAERRGRRVLRYDLDMRAAEDQAGGAQHVTWVGKFYPAEPETPGRVARVLAALAAAGFSERSGMTLPRVVGYAPAHHLLLLTYVPGEQVLRLRALSLFDRDYATMLERIARGLAALHSMGVTTDRVKTTAGIVAGLRRRADDLCAEFPAEAARIRRIFAQIEQTTPPDLARPALLHGDFGGSQLVWDGGRLGLIDFDKCALGDPALDLANFVVQLRRRALLDVPDAPPVETLRTLLLDAYRRHSADAEALAGLAERVTWHELAVLLKKAHYLARHAKHERRGQSLPLLGLLAALAEPSARA